MTTTATIPPRIYIRGAANKNIKRDFGHTASLFYIVIGAVNDLASHAMTDAVEAVRKSRHYRHSVKYHIREAQRKFDDYERMMKEQLTDRFPLFMDITDEVYEMIRPDMERLYFSFKSELDKHREPESELKARMETAIAMLDLAVYMFDRFFEARGRGQRLTSARCSSRAVSAVWPSRGTRLSRRSKSQRTQSTSMSPRCAAWH